MSGRDGAMARAAPRLTEVLKAAPTTGLAELVELAGLDRAEDFRGKDLRGWPLAHQNLRGFDFTSSDLRGTDIEAAIVDETTLLAGARLNQVARKRLRLGGGLPARRFHVPLGAYTKVHVPDLSDDELLQRVFVIRDPLALEQLTYVPPPTDQWLTYEGRYDVANKVRCAFGHPHNRGYAFRDEDGRRYLVGNSCGSTHLGLTKWREFANQRKLLEERASWLKGLHGLREDFAGVRPILAALVREPAIESFDVAQQVLATRHPALVRAVREASAFGGRVTMASRERDFAAEERARERIAKSQTKQQLQTPRAPMQVATITKTVAKDAGSIVGRAAFDTTMPLRPSFQRALKVVDAFLSSDVFQTKRDLSSTLANARRLAAVIVRAGDAFADHMKFFTAANLDLVAKWANENKFDDYSFTVEVGNLVMRRIDRPTTVLASPPATKIDLTGLDELRSKARE